MTKVIKSYFTFNSEKKNDVEKVISRTYDFNEQKTEDTIVSNQGGQMTVSFDPEVEPSDQENAKLLATAKSNVEVFLANNSIGMGTME